MCTDDDENPHLKSIIGATKPINQIPGWNGDIEVVQPNGNLPNGFSVQEACGDGLAWYGFSKGHRVGRVSTILNGNGRARLDFGNCGVTGRVVVNLDGRNIVLPWQKK